MLYAGNTIYKNARFTFAFDGKRLELVPFPGEEEKVRNLHPETVPDGIRLFTGEGISIGVDCLHLHPGNNRAQLVAFPSSDQFDPRFFDSSALGVDIGAYFTIANGCHVSGLRFKSHHLSRCFDSRQAISRNLSEDTRGFTIRTEKTKPITCSFYFKGKEVKATLFHNVTLSYKSGEPPLQVESSLDFNFPAENDYPFIMSLVHLARRFLRFCLQASDIEFDSIDLMGQWKEKSSPERASRCGEVKLRHHPQNPDFSPAFHIPLGVINGFEESLLRSLAAEKKGLTLRHLPNTNSIRKWDVARIILLAASFDFETSKLRPKDATKKECSESKSAVLEALSNVAKNGPGGRKTRKYAKWLSDILMNSKSASSRMMDLYSNDEALIRSLGFYSDSRDDFRQFAKRVEKLRNALAHGSIDIQFEKNIIDDSLLLERLVLAVQLLNLGLDDEEASSMIKLSLRR